MLSYARVINDVLDATMDGAVHRPHVIVNQAYDEVFNACHALDSVTKQPRGDRIRAKAIELAAACVRLVAEHIDGG